VQRFSDLFAKREHGGKARLGRFGRNKIAAQGPVIEREKEKKADSPKILQIFGRDLRRSRVIPSGEMRKKELKEAKKSTTLTQKGYS